VTAAMLFPAIAVGVVERLSYSPTERRLVARDSRDYDHGRAVLAARARDLARHGSLPRWTPGAGLRTTYPTPRRAPLSASRPQESSR